MPLAVAAERRHTEAAAPRAGGVGTARRFRGEVNGGAGTHTYRNGRLSNSDLRQPSFYPKKSAVSAKLVRSSMSTYGAIGRESLLTQPGVSSAEHAEVLSAMLRLAEGEIRAKDEQISLLHKMVGANEDEIGKKEGQIAQLNDQLAKLQGELDQFKGLFTKYLAKAEAARSTSAFTRIRASTFNDERPQLSNGGHLLPPASAAALVNTTLTSLGARTIASSVTASPSKRSTASDDDMLPPPPSEDVPYLPDDEDD